MFRLSRIHVEARFFDRHFLCAIAKTAQFAVEIISYRSLVAGNRLNVHQLPRQRNSVHERENSRENPSCGLQAFRVRSRPEDWPFLFFHPSRVI